MNSTRYVLRSGGWRALRSRVMKGLYLTADNAFLVGKNWERFDPEAVPERPLPWLPYCLTTFLEQTVPVDARVLEFGAGWGTVFWHRRQSVAVTAVERDREWARRVSPHVEGSRLLNGTGWGDEKFSLVVVDSHPDARRYDLNCALRVVSEQGVIVLDDTHRERERALGEQKLGDWKSIYWEGLGPFNHQKHGSTLFYREDNILGI